MFFVSVLIPNFNHSLYLEERINSVLSQTFQNFEVIILDDCSSDGSRHIIEGYRNHPKVSSIIFNNENSGSPFIQWKKGIDRAKGDWIWIAESDDYCRETFLFELIQLISDDVDMVTCQVNIINQQGEKIQPYVKLKPGSYDGCDFVKKKMSKGNHIVNASAVIFRKALLPKVDWNQIYQIKYAGDWLFWCMILKQGRLSVSPLHLSFFRRHDLALENKFKDKDILFIESLKILDWILKNYDFVFKEKFIIYSKWTTRMRTFNLSDFNFNIASSLIRSIFRPFFIYRLRENASRIKKFFRNFFFKWTKNPFILLSNLAIYLVTFLCFIFNSLHSITAII